MYLKVEEAGQSLGPSTAARKTGHSRSRHCSHSQSRPQAIHVQSIHRLHFPHTHTHTHLTPFGNSELDLIPFHRAPSPCHGLSCPHNWHPSLLSPSTVSWASRRLMQGMTSRLRPHSDPRLTPASSRFSPVRGLSRASSCRSVVTLPPEPYRWSRSTRRFVSLPFHTAPPSSFFPPTPALAKHARGIGTRMRG